MPAVSMAALRRSLGRDLGAGFGDIIYMSGVMGPRHEFLTANNQTPYVLTCLDLGNGPWVVEVPEASPTVMLFGSAIDSWEVPLVDLGATGEDAGHGGRYLFLPPGQDADSDTTTTEGGDFISVPSPTRYVHVGLRPITRGEGTLADAVAYSQRLRVYPLTAAGDPPDCRYVDAYPAAWHTLPTFDLDFLRLLAQVIEDEPAQEKDAVMYGALASIGIEKGRPFQPQGEQAAMLTDAVAAGAEHMNDYFMTDALERHWSDRHWMTVDMRATFGFSFESEGRLDYDRRAGGFAFWATFAPKRLGDPAKLPASYYLMSFRDAVGELFRADQLYRLRIPADTPADDFWSIVAYEVGTNGFIHTEQNTVGFSSHDTDRLSVNSDGSIDIYVGGTAPADLAQNWIRTDGHDFWLMFRFYGPQAALFDKTWTANDVERVN